MSNIIQIKQVIFRKNIYAWTYIHVPTINEKRDEFERQQEGVHVKVWREKGERKDDAIILQSQK